MRAAGSWRASLLFPQVSLAPGTALCASVEHQAAELTIVATAFLTNSVIRRTNSKLNKSKANPKYKHFSTYLNFGAKKLV